MTSGAAGTRRMTRAELLTLPEPTTRGRFHKPIPHHELLDTIEAVLLERKITPNRFQIGVQRETRLFATIDFDPASPGLAATSPDRGYAMGVRGSNDGRMAVQIATGGRVFICDNMAFAPGLVSLKRRHTIRLDLKGEVDTAVGIYLQQIKTLDAMIVAAQTHQLTDDAARSLIYTAFMETEVMSLRHMPEVHRLYFNEDPAQAPEITQHPRTLWALTNAFTRVARDLPAHMAFNTTTKLGGLLSLATK